MIPFAFARSKVSQLLAACLLVVPGWMVSPVWAVSSTVTGSTGSASPTSVSNTQPTLAMRWIISNTGNYPVALPGPPDEPLISEVRAIAWDSPIPTGWFACEGQTVGIGTAPALFSLLGTTYGGNGTTTFKLPDLRGRVPVGTGTGAGLAPVTLGQAFGGEANTLTSANLPAHTHSIVGGNTGSTGAGQGLVNAQPSLGMNMSIVGSGAFNAMGWIRIWAGVVVPGIVCDGSLLGISTNVVLWGRLGTTYGGNGTSQFGVPDLRGRALMGMGTGPGLTTREIGSKVGSELIVLDTGKIPAHTHTYPGGTTGSAGTGGGHSTIQPSLVVRPMIAILGSFLSFGSNPSSSSAAMGEVRYHAASQGFGPGNPYWADCNGATVGYDDTAPLGDLLVDQNTGINYYGGSYGTTVGLPDLRGRVVVGMNQGTGLSNWVLAQSAGAENVTVTTANLPAHTHTLPSAPANSAPTVARTSATVTVNEAGTTSNTGTFSDADGNGTVTLSASVGTVTPNAGAGTWSWSFTTTDGPDQSQTVTITANDGVNAAVTTTFALTVNNVAPTAVAQTGGSAVTIAEDSGPRTITLASTDPGADTRTYSIVTSPSAAAGTLGSVSGNSVVFTPALNFNGSASFTFKATDSDGLDSAPATVEINVTAVNDAPVAGSDGLTRLNNTKNAKILKTALLANDTDAEGDPLTIVSVGGALPAGSTVVIAGAFVSYTAPATNSGNGSFTYTLSDGPGGHTVVVTVPVTQVAPAPAVIAPNAASIVASGSDFILTFLGVPGNSYRVQYSAVAGPGFVWTEFSPPAVLTAPASGVFAYTDVNPPGPMRFYRAVPHP